MSVTCWKPFCNIALCIGVACISSSAMAVSLPVDTTFPVEFSSTLDAAKLHAGDKVLAKTTQVVLLPNSRRVAKGTILLGHVVESQPFQFDATPYAVQQPSYLAIRFDSLVEQAATTPLTVSVRALAGANEAEDARTPHGIDESDSLGEIVLVGGAHYRTPWKDVYATDKELEEETVGYNRKQGVFGHLVAVSANESRAGGECKGTNTEQSLGIFSPDACGLYGLGSISMTKSGGGKHDGVFRLQSRHRSVQIYRGSSALLQVVAD